MKLAESPTVPSETHHSLAGQPQGLDPLTRSLSTTQQIVSHTGLTSRSLSCRHVSWEKGDPTSVLCTGTVLKTDETAVWSRLSLTILASKRSNQAHAHLSVQSIGIGSPNGFIGSVITLWAVESDERAHPPPAPKVNANMFNDGITDGSSMAHRLPPYVPKKGARTPVACEIAHEVLEQQPRPSACSSMERNESTGLQTCCRFTAERDSFPVSSRCSVLSYR
ncbi:unnamed protein product [Leuciscus chuanchicus]